MGNIRGSNALGVGGRLNMLLVKLILPTNLTFFDESVLMNKFVNISHWFDRRDSVDIDGGFTMQKWLHANDEFNQFRN